MNANISYYGCVILCYEHVFTNEVSCYSTDGEGLGLSALCAFKQPYIVDRTQPCHVEQKWISNTQDVPVDFEQIASDHPEGIQLMSQFRAGTRGNKTYQGLHTLGEAY